MVDIHELSRGRESARMTFRHRAVFFPFHFIHQGGCELMDAPPRAAVRPSARPRGETLTVPVLWKRERWSELATEGDTQLLSAASGMSMTLVYFALS